MALWREYQRENADRFLEELLAFLRIPSISALPEHAPQVREAAAWVVERLARAGVERAQVLSTAGHPCVYGEWCHAGDAPTVLIYGHFDTQPVDPLGLWTHPPFEPAIEGDRIFARGASDDKGNMLIPILAVESLLATEGRLPLNVKFFFEGQEEIGSPDLPPLIAAQADLLSCDLVLNADAGQWSETEPQLGIGLRGICALQIDVQGARSDLHSGSYGGAVQNPIHALVRILDSMRSADGRILVEGFYDAVRPLTAEDRALIAAVPFDEQEFMEELGVPALFGEPGFTPRERIWARPTLEVNGIWGGFQGEGTKTVLPNQAHAKITCRLVPDQEPQEIAARVIAHAEAHCPPGVTVRARSLGGNARPYLIPASHPGNKVAHEVLREIYGVDPYYVRSGGTIAICDLLLTHLKAYTVSFGFGLHDECYHAPNEFFRISSFRRGQEAYVLLLQKLAERGL